MNAYVKNLARNLMQEIDDQYDIELRIMSKDEICVCYMNAGTALVLAAADFIDDCVIVEDEFKGYLFDGSLEIIIDEDYNFAEVVVERIPL